MMRHRYDVRVVLLVYLYIFLLHHVLPQEILASQHPLHLLLYHQT